MNACPLTTSHKECALDTGTKFDGAHSFQVLCNQKINVYFREHLIELDAL